MDRNNFFSSKDWIQFLSTKQQELDTKNRAIERKNWSCLIALGAVLLLLGNEVRKFVFVSNSLEAILYGELVIFYFFFPFYYFLNLHVQVPRITRRFRIRDVDDMKCLLSVVLAALCLFLLFNGYLLFFRPLGKPITLVASLVFLVIFLLANVSMRLWPEKTVLVLSYAQRKKPYRSVLSLFNLGLELSTVTILVFLLLDYVTAFYARVNMFEHLFLSGIVFTAIALFILNIIYFKLSSTFEDLDELQFKVLSGKLQKHSDILSEYEEQLLGKSIVRYIGEQIDFAKKISNQVASLLESSRERLQHAKACSNLTEQTKNIVEKNLDTAKKHIKEISEIKREADFYVTLMDFELDERTLLDKKLRKLPEIGAKINAELEKFREIFKSITS